MKRGVIVAGSLLLSACAGVPSDPVSLSGYWIETMPVDASFVQGIRLDADGGAASIGMHTLRYTGWERSGDRLLLSGESIGNGQTFVFTDTLDIVRLDADSMVLGRDGSCRIGYGRIEPGADAGISLLDSLRQPSPTSVLDVRIYEGSFAGEESVSRELTLYNYENSGDGVFRLVTVPVAGSRSVVYGRTYILRGDASDPNATVCQLRVFPESGVGTWNLRYAGDRLELLDESFSSVSGLLIRRDGICTTDLRQ